MTKTNSNGQSNKIITDQLVETSVRQGYVNIPSFIFRDRSVAVLEALVEYMKEIKKLSYHEIAVMLNRNDRTIWTVYRRAKLKRKGLIKHNSKNDE